MIELHHKTRSGERFVKGYTRVYDALESRERHKYSVIGIYDTIAKKGIRVAPETTREAIEEKLNELRAAL